jgi:hypothetical protein
MDTNEWLLVVAGIAVAVGVVMEGWEHREDIKTKGWQPLAPKIGFGILVLGLFVETYAEIRIGQADTQFRVDAVKSAADLTFKAQQLAADNLQLEQILLPRRVVNVVNGKESMALSNFAPMKFQVWTVPDLEAIRLARAISGVLSNRGWIGTLQMLPMNSALDIPDGVHLAVRLVGGDAHHTPDFNTPVVKASAAVYQYLRSGFLEDLNISPSLSKPGIDVSQEGFFPPLSLAAWWPQSIPLASDTLFVFVGMKPIVAAVSAIDWMNDLPRRIGEAIKNPHPFIVPGIE